MEISESEMFSFFEGTPDLVCIASKDGYLKNVNKAVIDTLGYSKEELFSRHISSFVVTEDREITAKTRLDLLKGINLVNFENRYITKDGRIVWLHWTSFFLPEKEVVFAIAKNITLKKEAEKEVDKKYQKFKNLADHFKRSLEKDRKQFAIDLHEELAQLAAVINMDINSILSLNEELHDVVKQKLTHASEVTGLLIQAIRKIAFEISPYMLDDFGLKETLNYLCQDFTQNNDISCNMRLDFNEADLTQEVKVDFFRICQEAMRNVIKHARATEVNLSILDFSHGIELVFSDNGMGFENIDRMQFSGLGNLRDRVESLNGSFAINSSKSEGTTLKVVISK